MAQYESWSEIWRPKSIRDAYILPQFLFAYDFKILLNSGHKVYKMVGNCLYIRTIFLTKKIEKESSKIVLADTIELIFCIGVILMDMHDSIENC